MDFKVKLFGLVYLSFTSLGILGGLLTGKITKLIGNYKLIAMGVIGVWITIGLTGFLPGLFALAGLVFIRFFYFLAESPLKVLINSHIENKLRASIFSLTSLVSSLMLLISRPFIGFLSDTYTTKFSFQIWFVVGIPLIILFFYLMNISKEKISKK